MDHYSSLTSYQTSAVMMTGVKTGVFRCLAGGLADAAGIAAETGLSLRGTVALLRSLEALGFVTSAHDAPANYQLTGAGQLCNETGANGLARLAIKESYFYKLWANLDDAVRSGQALLAPFAQRAKSDRGFVETFLLALNDLAHKSADGFFQVVRFDGVRRLLDLGGGAGGYATLIARRYPEVHVTLLELPEIVPIAARVVAAEGLTDRVSVVAGDIFAPGLKLETMEYDAVLVSHVLHDFDAETGRLILRQASTAVKSTGGHLILNDVFTGAGPLKLPETFFDLMMLVENPGGAAHPLAEVQRWVRESGWSEPVYQPLFFGGVLQAERASSAASSA
jgi:SAM-dependent methyltransferase